MLSPVVSSDNISIVGALELCRVDAVTVSR